MHIYLPQLFYKLHSGLPFPNPEFLVSIVEKPVTSQPTLAQTRPYLPTITIASKQQQINNRFSTCIYIYIYNEAKKSHTARQLKIIDIWIIKLPKCIVFL